MEIIEFMNESGIMAVIIGLLACAVCEVLRIPLAKILKIKAKPNKTIAANGKLDIFMLIKNFLIEQLGLSLTEEQMQDLNNLLEDNESKNENKNDKKEKN